jgi:hypothetical protein
VLLIWHFWVAWFISIMSIHTTVRMGRRTFRGVDSFTDSVDYFVCDGDAYVWLVGSATRTESS